MSTLRERFKALGPAARARVLRGLDAGEAGTWDAAWGEWAHAGQVSPAGDWRTWVVMAGRGFGKTRAGAEWVLGCVRSFDKLRMSGGPQSSPGRGGGARSASEGAGGAAPRSAGVPGQEPPPPSLRDGPALPSADLRVPRAGEDLRIALVAATVDEARRVMVEGASGILACARDGEVVDWCASRRELRLKGPDLGVGAVATLFSGANPEALRGPQHHLAWGDELAKWRHAQATWDMLQLGLRCGARPRALVTTTPRGGCAALAAILAAEGTVLTRGRLHDNPHLPAAFVAAMQAAYGGTRMGREEIDGEFVAEVAGSLWPAALLARCRGAAPGREALARVVVGVDPPAGAEGTCGIVACGLDADGVGWVLGDHSASGLSPEGWARKVAAAVEVHGADRVVAEGNQGGEMVRSVLRAAGIALPVTLVAASAGKGARAEPVAGLFECGRARLGGRFGELEAELAGMVPAGYEGGGGSPDRADAMVWALWALCLAPRAEPRVRVV